MYSISFNDTVIRLADIGIESHLHDTPNSMTVYYPGKTKFLLSCLDKIEKNKDLEEVNILTDDPEKLMNDFKSLFKVVKAAGGLVINEVGEVLVIFRRGSWDLPKGKIELEESKKAAAIREVEEETGMTNLRIVEKLVTTYHIYRTRSSAKRILKPSYWYLMYAESQKLTPQLEEDIMDARWVNLLHERENLLPVYRNIVSVFDAFTHYIKS